MNQGPMEEFPIDLDEPILTTGVVCRLINIPAWILKQLDVQGIICPKRESKKARLYSKRDLTRIQKVWYLMEKRGVKMNGIKVIIEMEEGTFKFP